MQCPISKSSVNAQDDEKDQFSSISAHTEFTH